jgi:hypothetical protein
LLRGAFVKTVGKAGTCKGFSFDTELLAQFDFSGQIDNNSFPSVSPDQQKKFQADFVGQFAKVRDQLLQYKWLAADAVMPPRVNAGPCCPPSDFHVFVSDAYDVSRSLVPAWQGQRGWMEFPAHRVVVGGASIAHELVHVLFPNGNRMLAEGLATYLQHKLLPKLPVYPNYGEALEVVVEDFLRTTFSNDPSGALWNMDLEGLEGISTPDELFMRIGTRPFIGGDPSMSAPPDPQQTKFLYAVAGSFVGFLLENPIEDDGVLTEKNFGTVYLSSPLRPLERDSGAHDRWQKAYQGKDRHNKSVSYTFKDLSLLWKTYMHFILFSEDEKKPPIPDSYRRMKLVSDLYGWLQGVAAQGSGQQPAAGKKQK